MSTTEKLHRSRPQRLLRLQLYLGKILRLPHLRHQRLLRIRAASCSFIVLASLAKCVRSDWQSSVFLMKFFVQGGFARVYEVKDVHGSRLACKVVTKSSLKTKKAKTKVQNSILISINGSLIHSFSFTPKSRFTARSNIPILSTSKIVSKTMTTST
jgi:hypothetical protein